MYTDIKFVEGFWSVTELPDGAPAHFLTEQEAFLFAFGGGQNTVPSGAGRDAKTLRPSVGAGSLQFEGLSSAERSREGAFVECRPFAALGLALCASIAAGVAWMAFVLGSFAC